MYLFILIEEYLKYVKPNDWKGDLMNDVSNELLFILHATDHMKRYNLSRVYFEFRINGNGHDVCFGNADNENVYTREVLFANKHFLESHYHNYTTHFSNTAVNALFRNDLSFHELYHQQSGSIHYYCHGKRSPPPNVFTYAQLNSFNADLDDNDNNNADWNDDNNNNNNNNNNNRFHSQFRGKHKIPKFLTSSTFTQDHPTVRQYKETPPKKPFDMALYQELYLRQQSSFHTKKSQQSHPMLKHENDI
ncbi:hypothetical protein RFI_09541 [Reticulomyxa filosa]|uniref:Uncharacterized protein n=1 Tax=Reticulomyxa filosa TaxID=46433 RepID=X6NNL3_RETFI|nr:hypothetical protein RFI_09541 [Reticulomyxa filosa]|eukprot:ETO27591.1 hypothetical protein RFI_09541 [Reticulomyxa filosa]